MRITELTNARNWATGVLAGVKCYESWMDVNEIAAARLIVAMEKPPSMADVEWLDDEHYLAEAENEFGDRVVMVEPDGDEIVCVTPGSVRSFRRLAIGLWPTGKHYKVEEVTGDAPPRHPEELLSMVCYNNAPDGTIVVTRDGIAAPYMKINGQWRYGDKVVDAAKLASAAPRTVVKWGSDDE